MRRWMAALLSLTLLLATACSSKPADKPADSTPSDSAADSSQKAEPVKLRFVSLAWQKQSIEANKAIVAAWNEAHPEIQVEYVQGDWGSIHDYMLTSFESGDVPDIFHYESQAIIDWANRGYIADLAPLIPAEMKRDIAKGAWDSVTLEDGRITGIPFLWESMITLYNKALFAEAGIEPPTVEDPWTWEEMREAAKRLTRDADGDGRTDQYGAAFGLKSPANRILNLSLNYDGLFFYEQDGKPVIRVGEAEKKVMRHIRDMMYVDGSASPDGVGQSGTSLLPGFFAGKYAMLPGLGVWARQQVVEGAPEGFEWGVLPPLKGTSQNQGSATQTLSIPEKSQHKKEAMAFIAFFLNTENMARLAQGDWLFPTRTSSLAQPEFLTEEGGWRVATESARHLILAPFQKVAGYPEWKSKVANPVLQEYFANQITLEEAARRLEEEGTAILARYNR